MVNIEMILLPHRGYLCKYGHGKRRRMCSKFRLSLV